MKKSVILGLMLGGHIMKTIAWQPLDSAPDTINVYKEIATVYNARTVQLFNDLQPCERVMVYYLHRAGMPGNCIAADQTHRHAVQIRQLFETIVRNQDALLAKDPQLAGFADDAKTYLVYQWVNNSQYFAREHANEKRTLQSLGLAHLTQEQLTHALHLLGIDDAAQRVAELADSIFVQDIEPTRTVPNSIDKSSVNIFSANFTDDDYQQLSPQAQQSLTAYHEVVDGPNGRTVQTTPYKIGGHYGDELAVCNFWLNKAYEHAVANPHCFDEHFAQSLKDLMHFFETGDEADFRTHCVSWLKSKSKIDYNIGFWETYDDPKGSVGSFQCDVTVKSLDIDKLNELLPDIEAALPIPDEFKRESLTAGECVLPNASINTKLFGTGHLGPAFITAAYCLPNYDDLRSSHGSKQIIYQTEKGIGERLNKEVARKLAYSSSYRAWSDEFDPEYAIGRDIWTLHVILHETLGHGSGKLATHTFADGEDLTFDGVTYHVGDTIPVTHDTLKKLLAGYEHTLEELRAEVIAMYTSVVHYDTFAKAGLLGDWPDKIDKATMINLLITHMTDMGWSRWKGLPDGSTTVAGDHARANNVIMNYVLQGGGVVLNKEQVEVDGEQFTVLATEVVDLEKALASITDLLITVQTIKSTADTQAVRNLIETYGVPIADPSLVTAVRRAQDKMTGGVKLSAHVYPHLNPIVDDAGTIVDVQATWPSDIFEQQFLYSQLAMSTE